MEVEDKKNYYSSLPSNYVTLAQLQERWLKERERKQKEEQLLQQKLQDEREPQPKIHRQVGPGNQTHKTGSWSATGNRSAKQYRPKNSNDSESNRPETREKSEGKAEIGLENTDQESKSNRLKKYKRQKRVNRKPRGDKDEGEETTEVAAQTTTVEGSETHEKSEGKADIGHDNADQERISNRLKKNKRNRRVNRKPRRDKEEGVETTEVASQTTTVEHSEDKRGVEKRAIKSELNDKSNNLMMEVEEKFGALSMNSGIGSHKQNVRLRRPNNGFHHRYPRNYGGRSHGYGDYGGRFRRQELQKPTGDKRVWVRKNESSDDNVGEIETASGSYKGSSFQK